MHILKVALAVAQALQAAANEFIEAVGSALGSGFIGQFLRSESGEVDPEQGFPVAWTGGLLIAGMVVLGMPDQARAGHHCAKLKNCSNDWVCTSRCTTVTGCGIGYCETDSRTNEVRCVCDPH